MRYLVLALVLVACTRPAPVAPQQPAQPYLVSTEPVVAPAEETAAPDTRKGSRADPTAQPGQPGTWS